MTDKIKCPNCGYSFDVEEALSGELEAQIKAEYEKKINEQADKFKLERKKLEEQKKLLEAEKERQNELIKTELAKALEKEKKKIEQSTFEQYEDQLRYLKEENEKRRSENKALKQKEVSLMRQEAALKEKEEELKLNVEKQILKGQREIEEKAKAKEREKFELEKIELHKKIEDTKKLAEEMRRKAEQGSMQLQGEAQELALEELLTKTYPYDIIQEVPKGVKGADCIQYVKNSFQQNCGSIVYESKRTKSFSNKWIDKLKQDQITCKADIALLVTETMPSEMDKFSERDGIWICSFREVLSVSLVLREMLIKINSVKKSQENKGDKMELLYNYLTSNEFVQNVKRIIENYDDMIEQLNYEKKAMHKLWGQREKQIWVVQENLSSLFGSIKGIAGKELDTSNLLELPEKQIEE